MSIKRKPPIALSLLKNSKSAIISAIEIHNKPIIKYRYEIVVLLTLNAWELLLKAYIHKHIKEVKLFDKSNTSKPFEDCLNIVTNKLGKEYFSLRENLKTLYKYRCEISHYYVEKLDIIIFGLLKQNIKFYNDFIKLHFNQDLNDDNDFVLLPLGFKKPFSPIDFISNKSFLIDSSKEIKNFIKGIIDSTRFLESHKIQEPIIVDYSINLTNSSRINNSDLIAGIDNQLKNSPIFTVVKKDSKPIFVSKGNINEMLFTNNPNESSAVLLHQEISENLFNEINNVIDANNLLSKHTGKFCLGEDIYYQIYSDRVHVFPNPDNLMMLSNVNINEYYVPFLFWFVKLSPKNCAKIILKWKNSLKHPNAYAFLSLIILLGEKGIKWLEPFLDSKFKKTQAPNYYYSFKEQIKKKSNIDIRLKALRMASSSNIILVGSKTQVSLKELLKNDELINTALTNECISVFKGHKESRKNARILDILRYGLIVNQKSDRIIEEINKNE